MVDFLGCRDVLLKEMARHDGLKYLVVAEDAEYPVCTECKQDDGSLRCDDCMDAGMYCSDCMVKRHTTSPLHVIRVCSSSSTS
jgi:hypothetical protein